MEDMMLANIKAKLRWAHGGVWSVPLHPDECDLLLTELEKVPQEPTGTVDVRQVDQSHNPWYVMGPDDEVPRIATPEEVESLGIKQPQPWAHIKPYRQPYIGDPGDEHGS